MMRDSILLVEDEPDGQAVITGLLEYLDIHADVAGTAEEALQSLHDQQYGAIIIDLALPGMDGLQLLQEIKATPGLSEVPCVVITAFHSSQVRKQVLDAGGDAYFAKPLDQEAFMAAVNRLIVG